MHGLAPWRKKGMRLDSGLVGHSAEAIKLLLNVSLFFLHMDCRCAVVQCHMWEVHLLLVNSSTSALCYLPEKLAEISISFSQM